MNHHLSVVWLRRDLRLEDNAALSKACAESNRIVVMFVFDSKILSQLKSKSDHRVTFIYDSLIELDEQLRKLGSYLIVKTGDPTVEVPKLVKTLKAKALYYNEDYEPYAKLRDKKVCETLAREGISASACKDHVLFSGAEINKPEGSPYKMFTPYKNSWLKKLTPADYAIKKSDQKKFASRKEILSVPPPTLKDLGFGRSEISLKPFLPGRKSALKNLKNWSDNLHSYHTARDFPSLDNGTSGLSVHLRFGTVSIRECVRLAMDKPTAGSRVWLSELIWRDFYQMILDRIPHVVNGSFKKEYDKIKWLGSDSNFKAWCLGQTGFPIVDAGMRQLNKTGWMHNRLRMITASFLVKDLLVDWRKGEAYFAEKLLDFDLAANNGGWQWCASTGCDAQPYFRIFNPVLQSKKFDSECEFIKKWVPELKSLSIQEIHLLSLEEPSLTSIFKIGKDYPRPIVSHSQQKLRTLKMYRGATT